jgi:hypothetical protein
MTEPAAYDLNMRVDLVPLVIAYERTKRNIVELLNKTIGNEWRLLCPFNVAEKFHDLVFDRTKRRNVGVGVVETDGEEVRKDITARS